MTIDELVAAINTLHGQGAEVTISETRVRVGYSGARHFIDCARTAGESPHQTIARALVAQDELAQIIARRDAAVVDAAARLAAAQTRAADARLHAEALMRAAREVTT